MLPLFNGAEMCSQSLCNWAGMRLGMSGFSVMNSAKSKVVKLLEMSWAESAALAAAILGVSTLKGFVEEVAAQ